MRPGIPIRRPGGLPLVGKRERGPVLVKNVDSPKFIKVAVRIDVDGFQLKLIELRSVLAQTSQCRTLKLPGIRIIQIHTARMAAVARPGTAPFVGEGDRVGTPVKTIDILDLVISIVRIVIPGLPVKDGDPCPVLTDPADQGPFRHRCNRIR